MRETKSVHERKREKERAREREREIEREALGVRKHENAKVLFEWF